MDKQLIDHRQQTADNRLKATVCSLQSLVCSLVILVLCPVVSQAATATTKTSGKSASTATTMATTAKTAVSETMTPFERALAAGKAASKSTLSSREKKTAVVAETAPIQAAASSPESIAFQKKIENLSQDKLIEAPAVKAVPRKEVATKAIPKPEEPKPVKKAITGKVTGINGQGLAVEYAQDEDSGGKEFWIDFDRKVKEAGGLKETAGLDVGDKVNAVYHEYPNMSKRLIQVKLLKKKPAEKEEA